MHAEMIREHDFQRSVGENSPIVYVDKVEQSDLGKYIYFYRYNNRINIKNIPIAGNVYVVFLKVFFTFRQKCH